MRTTIRGLVASVLAAIALALVVTEASAVTATISPGGSITSVNSGPFTWQTAFGIFECERMVLVGTVTAGSYSTTTLVAIGRITGGSTSRCAVQGYAISPIVLSNVPWSIALTGRSSIGGSIGTFTLLGFTFTETSTGCPFFANTSFDLSAPSGGSNVGTARGAFGGACGGATGSLPFNLTPAQTISP